MLNVTCLRNLCIFGVVVWSFAGAVGCGPSKQIPASDTTAVAVDTFRADTVSPFVWGLANQIYDAHIKTVRCHPKGAPRQLPIITRSDTLFLSFDDLSDSLHQYYYTLQHCNAVWEPTVALPSQYLAGLPWAPVSKRIPSRTSEPRYVHHRVTLPHPHQRFRWPGNYLLHVFRYDAAADTMIPALTRRVMVVWPRLEVSGEVVRPQGEEYKHIYQQVKARVRFGGAGVRAPFEQLRVSIIQDHRWDSALHSLEPSLLRDSVAEYREPKQRFRAGKPYRRFDMRQEGEQTLHLEPDKVRAYKQYQHRIDHDGHFEIQSSHHDPDAHWTSPYQPVHFTLNLAEPVHHGKLYVFGALTDWRALPAAQLNYDAQSAVHRATLLLKQGRYDYQYVFVRPGDGRYDPGLVEGHSFRTPNTYTVLAYVRLPGTQVDWLMGVAQIVMGAHE